MLTGLKRIDQVLKTIILYLYVLKALFVCCDRLSWLALEWYQWTINVFDVLKVCTYVNHYQPYKG